MKILKLVVVSFLLIGAPVYINAGQIPDTGQIDCFDNTTKITCPQPGEDFYGQDAQYDGPTRSYTKIGQNGEELPDNATQADGWIMTRDNVSGLVWEIKTDDGSIHDKDNGYLWSSAQTAFIDQLKQQKFGGYEDWRLPTIKELSSLVNSGIPCPGPTIDTTWFPNTMPDYYWSSSTMSNNSTVAWVLTFWSGETYGYYKEMAGHYWNVRAVRGEPSSNSFIDNGDGTVTDTLTGLMWQKTASANYYSWQKALAYAEGLSLGNYSDWRLPNRNELQTIVDYSRYSPAIDPLLGTNSGSFWSSTTQPFGDNYAYAANFDIGYMNNESANGYKNNWYYVRAVRDVEIDTALAIKLTASDPDSYDNFGESVSISGDYAIVGAKDNDHNNMQNPGSAYIFRRYGDNWTQVGEPLNASDPDDNQSFGCSVSISGDVAIVGAEDDDDVISGSGAAYIFQLSGDDNWVQLSKLKAGDPDQADSFGCSVSISEDYAIVGAEFDNNNDKTNSGAAYIFERSGDTWVQKAKLVASDPDSYGNFGTSVSISGDYAIVGADDQSHENMQNPGAAYIFHKSGDYWLQEAKLIASDADDSDNFGTSVSISGDYAIVGADYNDDDGTSSGSAYIFRRSGDSWNQIGDRLTAQDASAGDHFGISVSISGGLAVVGANEGDQNAITSSGAAYLFYISGDSWAAKGKLTAGLDAVENDDFGISVSISGGNAIIGAHNSDSNGSSSGSAYIFDNLNLFDLAAEFVDRNGIATKFPDELIVGQTYQITATYTAPTGIDGLVECGLKIVHPQYDIGMVYNLVIAATDGDVAATYGDDNADQYLSPISVIRNDLPDGSGVELTWNFFLKPNWPLTTGGIDFEVLALDKEQGTSGWNPAGRSISYEEPEFGATIITHGYHNQITGDLLLDPPEWTRSMGKAIGKRLGNAFIYQLDPITGLFDYHDHVMSYGEGEEFELIFIMDWAKESNDVDTKGFSEAAADAFVASLIRHQKENPVPYFLDRFHFIGHSRGCVVTSEMIERIVNLKSNSRAVNQFSNFAENISVTYLDPHPVYVLLESQADKVNPVETLSGQVDVWESVNYVENYYQEDTYPYGMYINKASPHNRNLDSIPGCNLSHSGVHAWYHGTIDPDAETDGNYLFNHTINRTLWYSDEKGLVDGFAHSPHGGNNIEHREGPQSTQLPYFNYKEDAIFNGNFDFYNAISYNNQQIPGWYSQGGEGVGFADGGHLELDGGLYGGNESKAHNWLYIPSTVKLLSFRYKVENSSSGTPPETAELIVSLDDGKICYPLLNNNRIWLNNETGQYVKEEYDLSPFIGTVAKIRFEIATNSGILDTIVFIDDVKFIFDSDNDGLIDDLEESACTFIDDADTDDDGIPDGTEDANQNGVVDSGETDPCKVDTDDDGIQDGTEKGLTTGAVGPDTDKIIFIPDEDTSTTTSPLLADTDGDGATDGQEDVNHNGRVDEGELDPNIQENFDNGLVAYYPLDGNALDATNNNNDGSLVNGVIFEDGRIGQCAVFDGINDEIVIPNTTSLQLANSISVAAWIYPTGNEANTCGHILSKSNNYFYSGGRNYELDFCYSTDFGIRDLGFSGGVIGGVRTSDVNALNTWYHIVGVYDATNHLQKIYRNGELINTRSTLGDTEIVINDSPLKIGYGEIDSHFRHFQGKIDDVRIYNRVLIDEEIATLANQIENSSITALPWIPLLLFSD